MATRAEHRRATLLALSDAAIDAFEADGVAATVDEIAERAGVSRRTVFRWVETKEELAFIHPMIWFDVFDEALRSLDQSLADHERLHQASMAIARHIDDDPERPRRAFQVAAAEPALAPGLARILQRWVDRAAEEVLAPDPDDDDRFRARIVGSAVTGVVDAVAQAWVADPSATFADLYEQGFDLIAPLFAEPVDAA